jgi:hypothetical protein
MDDAERIPIDIGYEVGAPALPSDPRTTVREDGTIVIDLLAAQPCAPATEGEIVVCGPTEEPAGYLPGNLPPPPTTTVRDKIREALSAQLGPLEVGLINPDDPTSAVGVRLKF